MKSETQFIDKKNAFDLLRILLAFAVVFTHSYMLGGYKIPEPLFAFSKGQTNFGEVAVMGFFTLSGYLITASYERTQNIQKFLSHRLYRIMPGFWVCMIVTAFILAPLIYCLKGSSFSSYNFTGDNSSATFVLRNLLLHINQWNIKDILASSAYQGSLNGSLWSLASEMACYFLVIIAGWFGLFGKNRMLYLLIFISVTTFFAISFGLKHAFGPTVLILSPAQKLYASFISGSVLFVFKDHFKLDLKGGIFSLLFAVMLLKFGGFHLISPLLIAIVLIQLFQTFELKLKYDISYGVYIYSFPVQQALYLWLGNKMPVAIFITISFIISAILGFLSYALVEKPAINLRKITDKWFTQT